MAVDAQGNIINADGTKTGGKVDLTSGQLITAPTAAPTTTIAAPPPSQPSIDVSKIGTAPSFTLPPAPTPAPYDIGGLPPISSLLNPAPTDTETEQKRLQGKLLEDTRTIGGKAAAQITAETAAGLPGFQKQLVDVNGQIMSLQAEAAAASNRSEDRLAPTFAIRGEQAQIERQRSVKALGLSAIAQTLQGNIALAQDQANKAVELQFAPVQAEIDYLTKALAINTDNLSREDKKRAETLTVQLAERQRLLDQQKADAASVHSVAATAAQFGAPAQVLNAILAAKDYSGALAVGAKYLQDPKAKYDLESARLDNILKQAQINKTNKETAQIGQPTAAETKALQAAAEQAKATVPLLNDKITLINSLLTSPGLASQVGPNAFARIPITAELTGAAQDFQAGVNQLISKETVDTLLALKAQGGTLGALSDQERIMLQQAASKIGTWQIKDGPGAGKFNASEAAFKAELQTIKTLAERAISKAQGNLLAPEEKSALNTLFGGTTFSSTANFNPGNYFNQ